MMEKPASDSSLWSVRHTDCVIAGGGPGGAVLALLLVRLGGKAAALPDFDREFRGVTLHPSVMEIMVQLGLAERLLTLRHTQLRKAIIRTIFLEPVTDEAARYPGFRLVMGARVRGLVEEGGAVRGVRYESGSEVHEVRARLTVGAAGRGSRVRQLAGFTPVKTSPPMDVLWFKLPRETGDPEGVMGRSGSARETVA